MDYPTLFLLEVFAATLVGVGSITYFRRQRAKNAAALNAAMLIPIGQELAQVIAVFLRSGLVVAYHHKEWCGMGFRYAEEKYIYGGTHDGEILTPSDLVKSGWHVPGRREFASSGEFVAWLAPMTTSDFFADDRHQPMTRERIVKAVEFCLRAEKSRWPNYAG